jgi:ABC-type maltose transport system permease subunit
MKYYIKVILIILAVGLSLASLLLLAITLSMVTQYSGQTMGNEAYGYFSAAFALTLLLSIPTIILWIILYKYGKQTPQ